MLAALLALQLSVSVAARAIQPGEVLLVTVTGGAADVASVDVAAFGHVFAGFPTENQTWESLVGIDLDQKPGHYVVTASARRSADDVASATSAIVVQPKTFRTRMLTVAPDYVNPPPATLARIQSEQRFLDEIYASSADQRLWRGSFLRPVPQPANSAFGTRSVFNGERRNPHAGTDFMAPAGTPVIAPAGGRVVAARDLFFTGNTVIIDHGLGVISMLAHLSRLDVQEGESIEAGDPVGLVGATGRVTGPHLHWSLRVGPARVNPLSALAVLGKRP